MPSPVPPTHQAKQRLVGIICDRSFVGGHDHHGVKESYCRALTDVSGVAPIFIPATDTIADVTPYLRVLSGLLLPGGASNVVPALYGGEEPAGILLDPARDHVAMQLLRAAVSRGLPMLAIGRGFQELNVAFGGTLPPISTPPGTMKTTGKTFRIRSTGATDTSTGFPLRRRACSVTGCAPTWHS